MIERSIPEIAQVQELQRKLNKHQIKEADANRQIAELQEKINAEVRKMIEEDQAGVVSTGVEAEVAKVSVGDGRKERGKNVESGTALIINYLRSGQYKNIGQVAQEIQKVKTNRTISSLKQQINSLIALVKAQSAARWKTYDWNEEKFLLTVK